MIRINWKTYQQLRQLFPAYRGESAADYFQRVADAVETGNI